MYPLAGSFGPFKIEDNLPVKIDLIDSEIRCAASLRQPQHVNEETRNQDKWRLEFLDQKILFNLLFLYF